MSFKEEYLHMKNELYLNDQEIAEEMMITMFTLYEKKKRFHIVCGKRPRKNEVGLSEEMLQVGERNGLSRKLMYKRVREYQWDYKRAITEPINIKIRKGLKRD